MVRHERGHGRPGKLRVSVRLRRNPMADGTPHLDCDVVMKGGITSGVIFDLVSAENCVTASDQRL
jgi:hypothetical protein